MISAIILTRDEELHIARAIDSVRRFTSDILIVDSGSTDKTVEIARGLGARVISHPWTNYASQFNWALEKLSLKATWVLRLDADEYVSDELAGEILRNLAEVPDDVNGIVIPRYMNFLGYRIRWGGLFPIQVLRLFRRGYGHCEERWMDEHIVVGGRTINYSGPIVDDNRKSLSWWISKHNSYASREAVDLLLLEQRESVKGASKIGSQAGRKRRLKESLYARLPLGFRALCYFLFRFILGLGFLEGGRGIMFHVLQGFWYRYLVDCKIDEVRFYMANHEVDLRTAIQDVLGIEV